MSTESKTVQAIPLDTIGINGLDTQSNATALGPNWFTKADNIVYTEGGKVTFRKGLKQGTLQITGSAKIGSIVEHYNGTTTKHFCSTGGKIYELDLSDKDAAFINAYSPSGVTTSDWQWQTFNKDLLGFQAGNKILQYKSSTWALLEAATGYTAPAGVTTFDPSCGLGYYGRVWAGGISEENDVLYYSDLLDSTHWSSGDAGYIDLKSVWGSDEIVAIHSFAGKLAIFGKENIVLYNSAEDISNIGLDEVIRGIGCVSRDSIQAVGDDLLFLSNTGVRSLIRTAEFDKLPLQEKSPTIKDELIANIKASTNVKSAYMLDEGLYLLSFVAKNVTYVFDLQFNTDRQTPRVTKWTFASDRDPASLFYSGTYGLLVGQQSGRVATYEGYYDVDYSGSSVYTYNSYTGSFSTVWIDLGQGVLSSILKRLVMVVSGGQGTDVGIRVYKDFELEPKLSPTFKLNPALSGTAYKWGDSEARYGTTIVSHTHNATTHPANSKYAPIHGLKEHSIPLSGSAKYLRLEMDGVTKGHKASLQSLSLLFKQGKTL